MTNKEKLAKANNAKLDEIEAARETLANPAASPEDHAKAEAVLREQLEIENELVDEMDVIMDIDDLDEREKAFDKWFKSMGA